MKRKTNGMKYTYIITLTILFIIIQYSIIDHPILLAVVNTVLMINILRLIWSYYEKGK